MAQAPSPIRVLVIDDDAMSRELLLLLLEAEGYVVAAAESGEAALALLESTPRPDIVLTDMQMPGATPGQLAGRLRRACGRHTLLLAMSGSRPPDATLAHFDAFLIKPLGVAEIEAAIAAHRSAKLPAAPKKSTAKLKKPATPRPPMPVKAPRRTAMVDSLAASSAAPASNSGMNAAQASVSHVNAPTPLPALDETIYRQLSGAMPSAQLHEMYTMCLNDARARIATMRTFADAHDAAQFMREAHAIKGSCGMLGAAELHRIAATLERAGPDPAGSGVNSLDELSNACDRLERMLGARA